MEAALKQSEREAHEAARRDEQDAVAEAREAEIREATEIAEALRLVEEATRKERAEFEEALRAVALAESGVVVPDDGVSMHVPSEASALGSLSLVDTCGSMPAEIAEQQLATLMELGYHAELAAPFCDGISSIEEILEELSLSAAPFDGHPEGTMPSAPPSGARQQRRWQGVAKKFLPSWHRPSDFSAASS